jgi:AraC family transcriptional regulator
MTDSNVLTSYRGEFHGPVLSAASTPRRRNATISVSLERMQSGLPVLCEETTWRLPNILQSTDEPNPRLIAARWHGTDLRERSSEIAGDYHMFSMSLQPSEFSLWLGAASFPHQAVAPGTIQITRPALPARIVYHRPYDVLHLYMQNSLLKECFEWSHNRRPAGEIIIHDPLFSHDAVLEMLGTTLLSITGIGGSYDGLLADFLSLSIIIRVLGLYGECPPPISQKVNALAKWRLRRAIEFIEAHTDAPVALADLARVAGLSRMHFAAQFRAATGLRPHEYMLHRRIEKAQAMLATSDMRIVEVALTCGFASQAHFTTAFRRVAGLTPNRWRQRYCA